MFQKCYTYTFFTDGIKISINNTKRPNCNIIIKWKNYASLL